MHIKNTVLGGITQGENLYQGSGKAALTKVHFLWTLKKH